MLKDRLILLRTLGEEAFLLRSTCRVGHQDAAVHDIFWCQVAESLEYHMAQFETYAFSDP